MPGADPAPPLVRVCLDLNVWVADFLATRRGRRGGSGPWLVDAVRAGRCPAGSLQLVVSLGMLERLGSVLVRVLGVDAAVAETAPRAIAGIASLGPAGDHPYAVLGSGVAPIRDEEDRHVMEIAVVGRADVLATANLADFAMDDFAWVGDGSGIRIYTPPGRPPLVIAHPDHVSAWLRAGRAPTAEVARGGIPISRGSHRIIFAITASVRVWETAVTRNRRKLIETGQMRRSHEGRLLGRARSRIAILLSAETCPFRVSSRIAPRSQARWMLEANPFAPARRMVAPAQRLGGWCDGIGDPGWRPGAYHGRPAAIARLAA